MATYEMMEGYPLSKFAADNSLSDPIIVEKYETAASIVNHVLAQVLQKITAGISTYDLCDYGDRLLEAYANTNQNSGIAFPTCVSVNDKVQHFSPVKEDYLIKANDVVKIELGAHIDGYIATAAHTTVVNLNPSQPISDRSADVICATHQACEAAVSMLKPGVKGSEITRVIGEIAAYFRCKPVEGTYSSMMKRYVLHAGSDIENSFPENIAVKDLEKRDFEIEANQVYHLNIVLTTGDGKTKKSGIKTTLYQRDVNQSYLLKLKSARQAYNEINDNVFPFSVRTLKKDARVGVSSLESHKLIVPLPVVTSSSPKDFVAQSKATVLVVGDNDTVRTTVVQTPPFVHSTFSIPESTDAARAISSSTVRSSANKALPEVHVAFGEGRTEANDVDMDMN